MVTGRAEQSWHELLVDLKQRGLVVPPKLAVGDGALGFWAALHKAYPGTREQRCWMHKSGNALDKLPKSVQPRAKDDLHQVWMAETRKDAEAAFALFLVSAENRLGTFGPEGRVKGRL